MLHISKYFNFVNLSVSNNPVVSSKREEVAQGCDFSDAEIKIELVFTN